MREQLLGYLVGALDEDEAAEIRAALANDPALREELAELRDQVALLESDAEPFEPPAALAEKTCMLVAEHAESMQPRLSEPQTLAKSGRWNSADWIVAAGICVAASLLFVTSVSNSRFHAHVAGCQNNLRQVGQALSQYADSHHGYFPRVPTSGNLAVAGVYAPSLIEGGFLDNAQPVFCPAESGSCGNQTRPQIVPSLAAVTLAQGSELRELQQQLGGSYGYSLGYLNNGVYQGTRNQHRDLFPVLADAPHDRCSDDPRCARSRNHGGAGQNVLFESGRVKFLSSCRPGENCCDNFFTNDDGDVAAGRHEGDAVIGNSGDTPLQNLRGAGAALSPPNVSP